MTPSVIVVGRIDWRFADPSADAIAGINCSQLPASPLAHSLIVQLAANEGLNEADLRKIFEGLSGANQVALSVREDRIVLMVTGRTTDSTVPALESGWKSIPVVGNAMLIGNAEAVDQAFQRISMESPLGELARMASQRQADNEFWAAGSAKLAGPEAVTAGVKRFSLTASLRDRLTSDTAFEFDGVPDASALRAWLTTLGGATIEGNVVHVKMSMEAETSQPGIAQIAGSSLGQRWGALVKTARYLPVRDATAHTKPVIYGLDSGPKEVNQYPNR